MICGKRVKEIVPLIDTTLVLNDKDENIFRYQRKQRVKLERNLLQSE